MTASDSPRAQFERLLEEHAGTVRKIAFGYARTESDRRDLMQEIALQLWRAYPRYSPDRPFSTWMYRIALNVSISLLRRNTRPGRETVPFDELKHDSAHEQSIREDVFGKRPKMQLAACAPQNHATAAITLSSIAIGVGKAVISIVVRVGFGLPAPAKCSA
jgi:RNA polymerase sigma factor (sigma-70 family)